MRKYQEKTQQRFFTLPSTVITILANNKWQSVHLARIGSIRSASKFLIKCSNNWSQVSVEVQSPRAETKLGNKWINYTNNRDNFRISDQFVQIQVTHISWRILFIEVFSVKAQGATSYVSQCRYIHVCILTYRAVFNLNLGFCILRTDYLDCFYILNLSILISGNWPFQSSLLFGCFLFYRLLAKLCH